MGQEGYRRVCTCLYGDDKTTVLKNESGEERCDYYDGKVLGGKGNEFAEREKKDETTSKPLPKGPKIIKPTKLYEHYNP